MRKRYAVTYFAEQDQANPFKFGVPPEAISTAGIGDPFWQLDDIRKVIEDPDFNGHDQGEMIKAIFDDHKKYEVVEDDEKPLLAHASASPEKPPAPETQEKPMADPDFIYDPEEWEYTTPWEDRVDLLDDADLDPGEVREFATLVKGPAVYASCVVLTRDEDGSADETELRWFDTEEEAHAAQCPGGPPAAGGEDAATEG